MKKLIVLTILIAAVLLATAAPALALTNTDCLACHGAPSETAVNKLVSFQASPVLTPAKCVVCHDGTATIHAGNAYVDTPYGKFLSNSVAAQPGWTPNPDTIHTYHMGYTKGGVSFESFPTICGTEYCHAAKVDCEWCHGTLVTHQLNAHGNGPSGTVVPGVSSLVVNGKSTAPATKSLTCLASQCHAVIQQTPQPNIRLAPSCGQPGCHSSESHEVVHGPSAAITTEYGSTGENCVVCHSLNLVTEHVDQPLGCGTCHNSTVPAVQGAIATYKANGTKAGCRVCHGVDAGMHTAVHSLTNPVQPPSTCQSASCHVDNLVTEHLTNRRSLTCDTCHAGSADVQQVITAFKNDALNPECEDCHGAVSGTQPHALNHELTTPVAPPAECSYCHSTNLLPVHIDPVFPADVNSSTWSASDCNTCHSPSSRVASQVAAFAANTAANPDCATCHTITGIHAEKHQSTSTACFDTGCHASSNLVTLHAGYGRTCDTCHTADPNLRPAVRQAILANDTACESCHGAGHFQQHDLPAGKTIVSGYYQYSNQSSGTTDCAICHTNNVILEHTGDATTGRPAWLGANGSPLNCDTCHTSTRAVVVAAIAAAKTGQLTNCDQCHTVHGTPTLEHQSPTSAPDQSCGQSGCHYQNLLVEHELRWSASATELQNNTAMIGGVCSRCHLGQTGTLSKTMVLAAIDNADNTCQACHGANAGAGHTATHDPDAALTSAYASCNAAGCHVLNVATEHVGRTFNTGVIGSCNTCHATNAPAYAKNAIAAWKTTGAKQGCFVCHGANAGQHAQQHELVNPPVPECTLCHSGNLVTEHTVNNPLGCDACHGSGAPATVKSVISTFGGSNPLNPVCTSCHTAYHADAVAKHTANEGTDCKSCHLMMLPDEHARSTSISNSRSCGNCHPLPGSFVWTYKCADCHKTGGLAPVRHPAETTKHVSSQTGCAKSGCHATDLKTVHSSVGCGACHSTTKVPTSSDCRSCHTGGAHHDTAPSFKFALTSAGISQACRTACHEHDYTHKTGQDCWRCHGPGQNKDFHTVESEHQQSSACGKCHNASLAQAASCTQCHSFGANWWTPYETPTTTTTVPTTTTTSTTTTTVPTTTTTTTSSTTTSTSSTTSTTSTTVPTATEYKVNKAEYLEGLNNDSSDSRADRRTDVTGRMGDGSNSNSYQIRRDREMMSLQLDQSGATVSGSMLRLYVTQVGSSWGWGSSTQKIRVYRYQSDGNSVSSSYQEFTVGSTGWIDLDVTSLVKATSGSSFKLRVTCGSDYFNISEARIVLTR